MAQLQKKGDKFVVEIPKQILLQAEIQAGDKVDIKAFDNKIIVKKINKYTLDELLEGVTSEDFTLSKEDKLFLDSCTGKEKV